MIRSTFVSLHRVFGFTSSIVVDAIVNTKGMLNCIVDVDVAVWGRWSYIMLVSTLSAPGPGNGLVPFIIRIISMESLWSAQYEMAN
jgi:hypothetical protein